MASVVTDTHALIWSLFAPTRLSAPARATFEQAILAGDPVYSSAISVVEVRYLCERGRLASGTYDQLLTALRSGSTGLVVAPLEFNVACAVAQVPRAQVPEMPDRIIAATALYLNLPLVTRDTQIRASSVPTIW